MIRTGFLLLITPFILLAPARAAEVEIAGPTAFPGQVAEFSVSMRTGLPDVEYLASAVGLPAGAQIVSRPFGKPDCQFRAGRPIDRGFFRTPLGCQPDSTCTAINLLAFHVTASEDGVIAYSCNLVIKPGTPVGSHPITCGVQEVVNHEANEAMLLDCQDGAISVLGCSGDCDQSGTTDIAEIVRGILIAVGQQSIEACDAMDADRDGRVDVSEVVLSLNNSLGGCQR